MEPIFENYWKLLSEKNAACRIISTIFVHLLIMLDIFASSCKDTKRTRLLQHNRQKLTQTTPKSTSTTSVCRPRRHRLTDVDDVDSEVMEEGQKRFRKSARDEYDGRGVGKVK